MIIAVSGWRYWDSKASLVTVIGTLIDAVWANEPNPNPMGDGPLPTLRFGDNPGGIDQLMWEIVIEWRLPHERYIANWDEYGKAAGPLRNRAMLKGDGFTGQRANLLLAFPEPQNYPKIPGSGTWGCIGEAARMGIQTTIYPSLKLTIPTGYELEVFGAG